MRSFDNGSSELILGTPNPWRSAALKALLIQISIVGFLSLVWFGFAGGADNPLWFYLAVVLEFPTSLFFTPVLGVIAKTFPDDLQRIEVAGLVVAFLQFLLLTVAIKKIRDFWLS
jgi:hypothetical protein